MSAEEKYPLYPPLPEPAKEEAQKLFDQFKEKMKRLCDETLGQLYCDVAIYIESDSWNNFRNALMDGFRDYSNRSIQGEYDFKAIRQKIFADFREEIIKDLNQDNLKRIEELEKDKARLIEDYDNVRRRGYP